MGNWINVHVAELEARIEALEWLVEVMELDEFILDNDYDKSPRQDELDAIREAAHAALRDG